MTGERTDDCFAFVDALSDDCRDAIADLDPVSAAQVRTMFTMAIDRCHEPRACWEIMQAIRAKVAAGPVLR